MGLNDVRIIGVWGMGRIGKTTLARVVFHMVSNKFEGCCFLANVREVYEKEGLVRLQEQFILQIFNESMSIQDVCHGVSVIENRLRHKRILLVLDDVNQLDQINKLAEKRIWFGSGSRVIITTRDRHLLEILEVEEIFDVEGLNYNEALHLLSLKAFKKVHPPKDYIEVSKDIVYYANGLPLAIEILGSFLFDRSIDKWKSTLNKLKEFPNNEILKVLKISFDGLDEVEKEIFLHIACFFNHKIKNDVVKILAYLHLSPNVGMEVLVEKSLIKVRGNRLWMHDLLQQMGRDIVYQECPKEPGKRSRLWSFWDINNVLTNNKTKTTGTEAVQGVVLEFYVPKMVDWNPEAFAKLQYLKLLKICGVHLTNDLKHLPNSLRFLDWKGYPLKSLPSSFQSNELVELCMCCSYIERLWKGTKSFEMLKFIKLTKSQKLIETPNIIKVPNLMTLVLEDCINLRTIHPSIGIHKMLTILNLEGCKNLTSLPSKFEMDCLTYLNLSRCSKIKQIPEFGRNMKRVHTLLLGGTAITKLPTSIEHLTNLDSLSLWDCKNLVCLPSTICNLKLVRLVDLYGCSKLNRLLENLGNAESLERLYMSKTAIRKVPSSIGLLKNLKTLSFNECKGLSSSSSNKLWNELLPFYSMRRSPDPMDMLFSSLSGACSLTGLNLSDCNLKVISDDIGSLFSLELLDLSGNDFVCLPESIIQLLKLKWVVLDNCTSLRSLPKLPLNIESIYAEGSEMPEWFRHQSMGAEVNIKQPSHLYNEWMGIVVCIVFCSHDVDHQISCLIPLYCSLTANGKRMSPALGNSLIPKVLPDHLWLLYVTPQFFDEKSNKLLSESDANGFTQIGIKIETGGPSEEVKKCGFRMIYNKDIKDLDRTMAQHSNSSISPYESMAMIVECDKAKRSCDDYDGAGLSGEGSSNDISNPKRIKRHTETHGNSDCEE
ncbi:TMV resistance protein N-like [Quercus lobata]|uniref:TMV resistance protein N-like n=1 Tax=Quercus lobata TaxID=97700 RepID=UPI001247C8DD|nr:TMV resistance protein N-like [Quercus lobata]